MELSGEPHESPGLMVVPLIVLACFTLVLGFLGTPAWPWFQSFMNGERPVLELGRLTEPAVITVMVVSTVAAFGGIGLGLWLYGRKSAALGEREDALERSWPNVFALLRRKYFVDEVYEWTFVRLNAGWAKFSDWCDRWVWNGVVGLLSYLVIGISWVNRFFDEYVVNFGFDRSCRSLQGGGGLLSRFQNGRVQNYLRVIGVALVILVLFLILGSRAI